MNHSHFNTQKQWVERNDNVAGFVYLLEAEGFHGRIEGKFIKRCKIGLSRNVDYRIEQLETSQPPCNYKLLKAIYVTDMASIEGELHRIFSHCNVKLNRSKEYFDFNLFQYAQVLNEFDRYERRYGHSKSSALVLNRAVIGSVLALLGVSILIGTSLHSPQGTISSVKTVKQHHP